MRAIRLARLDKTRPVLVMTRDAARDHMTKVTVAPITSTVRGISTEVPVGPDNGLEHGSVVSCDNLRTIDSDQLGRQVGWLLADQEVELARALVTAFDLRVEELP